MKTIKAIIIDDEISSTETFAIELGMYCPQVEILAKCNSAADGLSKIAKLKPDLVFLDVEMPWMNGFELLEQIEKIDFEVVFVTAHDAFALKAFKVSAADYLLKPIKKEELVSAVERVRERLAKSESANSIESLLSNVNFLQLNIAKISFATSDGIEFLSIPDIIYCESDNNYTFIYNLDGSRLLVSKTLKQIENILEDYHFLRIHQSYLINLRHIKKYHRGQGGSVVLANGKELPVARARKDIVLNRLS
jgi:two-component system LytT family response regulator